MYVSHSEFLAQHCKTDTKSQTAYQHRLSFETYLYSSSTHIPKLLSLCCYLHLHFFPHKQEWFPVTIIAFSTFTHSPSHLKCVFHGKPEVQSMCNMNRNVELAAGEQETAMLRRSHGHVLPSARTQTFPSLYTLLGGGVE